MPSLSGKEVQRRTYLLAKRLKESKNIYLFYIKSNALNRLKLICITINYMLKIKKLYIKCLNIIASWGSLNFLCYDNLIFSI